VRRDKEWAAWSKGLVLVPAGIALLSGILDVHGHISQQDEDKHKAPSLPFHHPLSLQTAGVFSLASALINLLPLQKEPTD